MINLFFVFFSVLVGTETTSANCILVHVDCLSDPYRNLSSVLHAVEKLQEVSKR